MKSKLTLSSLRYSTIDEYQSATIRQTFMKSNLTLTLFFYINITPFKITQIRGDIRICFHEYV